MKTSSALVLIASVCGCLLAIGCASTPEGQTTQEKKYPTAESIFKEGDVKNHPPTIYQHPIEDVRPAAARALSFVGCKIERQEDFYIEGKRDRKSVV